MIKSSPEYAITKPGMSHSLPRKRDKPLRTYGKRSAPAPDARGEPLSKKPRPTIENTALTDGVRPFADLHSSIEGESVAEEHTEVTVPAGSGAVGPRSAGILDYFKPLAKARPAKLQDKSPEPSLRAQSKQSPRSSTPEMIHARRTPRISRLRAASSSRSRVTKEKTETQAGEEVFEDDDNERRSSNVSVSRDGEKAGGDTESPLLNRATNADQGVDTKAKKARRVQMTLNISTRAAFAECKCCNTVWNPLYPDDVKYHAKRHATVMRAKQKKQDDL